MSSKGGGLGAAELPQERVIFHLDDGSTVDGRITIPRRGMRMSDYLAGSEREFINVAGATLTLGDGSGSEYSPFIMIARKSIRMIKPGPRDEAEGDLSVWDTASAPPPPPAEKPAPPKPADKPEEEVDPRKKTGIYPPREPAVHIQRQSSPSIKVPEELRKKKRS